MVAPVALWAFCPSLLLMTEDPRMPVAQRRATPAFTFFGNSGDSIVLTQCIPPSP